MYWSKGLKCEFGDGCSFAHGEEELRKKTHVPRKYKMHYCTSFMSAPHFCRFGARCQFLHVYVDFSNFCEQKTPYQNLLAENTRLCQMRLSQIENPYIDTFNIANPGQRRLQVFQEITNGDVKDEEDLNESPSADENVKIQIEKDLQMIDSSETDRLQKATTINDKSRISPAKHDQLFKRLELKTQSSIMETDLLSERRHQV